MLILFTKNTSCHAIAVKLVVFFIVGHADIDMTQHYLHVQESIRKSAVEKFSAAFPCDVETE